jgi:hypothetical protein
VPTSAKTDAGGCALLHGNKRRPTRAARHRPTLVKRIEWPWTPDSYGKVAPDYSARHPARFTTVKNAGVPALADWFSVAARCSWRRSCKLQGTNELRELVTPCVNNPRYRAVAPGQAESTGADRDNSAGLVLN